MQDLFQKPYYTFTAIRGEVTRRDGISATAALASVAAMSAAYIYGMNGFDGIRRSADKVSDQITLDCGNSEAVRKHKATAKAFATFLRGKYGKGGDDATCRDIIHQMRFAKAVPVTDNGAPLADPNYNGAEVVAVDLLLDYLARNNVTRVVHLKAYIGKPEVEPKGKADPESADTDGADGPGDTDDIMADAAAIAADKVTPILLALKARCEHVGFDSGDYATLCAMLLQHVHGDDLATLASMVNDRIGEEMALAA